MVLGVGAARVTETPAHREEARSLLGGISPAFRINPFTGAHLEVRAAHGATIEMTPGLAWVVIAEAEPGRRLRDVHTPRAPLQRRTITSSLMCGIRGASVRPGDR